MVVKSVVKQSSGGSSAGKVIFIMYFLVFSPLVGYLYYSNYVITEDMSKVRQDQSDKINFLSDLILTVGDDNKEALKGISENSRIQNEKINNHDGILSQLKSETSTLVNVNKEIKEHDVKQDEKIVDLDNKVKSLSSEVKNLTAEVNFLAKKNGNTAVIETTLSDTEVNDIGKNDTADKFKELKERVEELSAKVEKIQENINSNIVSLKDSQNNIQEYDENDSNNSVETKSSVLNTEEASNTPSTIASVDYYKSIEDIKTEIASMREEIREIKDINGKTGTYGGLDEVDYSSISSILSTSKQSIEKMQGDINRLQDVTNTFKDGMNYGWSVGLPISLLQAIQSGKGGVGKYLSKQYFDIISISRFDKTCHHDWFSFYFFSQPTLMMRHGYLTGEKKELGIIINNNQQSSYNYYQNSSSYGNENKNKEKLESTAKYHYNVFAFYFSIVDFNLCNLNSINMKVSLLSSLLPIVVGMSTTGVIIPYLTINKDFFILNCQLNILSLFKINMYVELLSSINSLIVTFLKGLLNERIFNPINTNCFGVKYLKDNKGIEVGGSFFPCLEDYSFFEKETFKCVISFIFN